MSFLDVIAYLLVGTLFCGFVGIGVATNHDASAKVGFIVGAIIGGGLTVVGLSMGMFPGYF